MSTDPSDLDDVSPDAANDIRLSFDRVPETYDRVRPSYPPALFDALFAELGPGPAICEVGPGTGQATRTLLARGAAVTAVELGPHLAEKLEAELGCDALRVVNADFADPASTPELESGSFDAIVSATAYHWIRGAARLDRPHDLLRPGGVLGVIDLVQVDDPAVDRSYFERVHPIYDAFDQAPERWTPAPNPDEVMPAIATESEASDRFASTVVHRVRWDQTYTAAAYRDLLMTYSGTHMLPEPQRSSMVDQLVAVIDDEFDGVLTRPLVAALTIARRLG